MDIIDLVGLWKSYADCGQWLLPGAKGHIYSPIDELRPIRQQIMAVLKTI